MKKKAAVISMVGLGDGIVALVLSNNLSLNGYEVDTYHDRGFDQLQKWFPHLPIKPFPDKSDVEGFLDRYDMFFVCYYDIDPFITKLIEEGKKKKGDDFIVINPSFSKNYTSAPYYADAAFLPHINYVQNLKRFCLNKLKLPFAIEDSGIANPYNLISRKNGLRVVIHPTAAKKGRIWTRTKFVKLALKLKKMGFFPYFLVSPSELPEWEEVRKEGLDVISFPNLDKLATFIYESGYMIGNDSGIGHLASAMRLPTLTISRSLRTAKLWRPAWGKNIVVHPPMFLPNIKRFRFRDQHWQLFVSVRGVLKKFRKLLTSAS